MCLYGHDLEEDVSPIEASLNWTIPKGKREQDNYLGAGRIKDELAGNLTRKRVGFKIDKGASAREGVELKDTNG